MASRGRLLAAGEQVRVYRNDAFWLDIGRPDDYARAQDLFANDPGFFGLDTRSPEPSKS
ncbi:MAG: hypothetical protein AAFZ05_04490 [Pseudomonadota bacterium]